MARLVEIKTPLADDTLLLRSMRAHEQMSRISDFRVELLSLNGELDLNAVLGKAITVKLALPDDGTRYLSGYVSRFTQLGTVGRYFSYVAIVRPWLWLLTRTADCRIFQNMTVPAIVQKVFADHDTADFKLELTGSYPTWNYCVQYRETDFNFVSRLLEHEGIYYYFRHAEGRSTLVLTDSYSGHSAYKPYEQLSYISAGTITRPEIEYVWSWEVARTIQPGAYVHDNFDLTRPNVELKTRHAAAREHAQSSYEIYDYPGTYLQKADGEQYAQVRLDELASQFETVHAASNARGVCVGRFFTLSDHPRASQNREYLILSSDYELFFDDYESTGSGAHTSCRCNFVAMSSQQQYRPPRVTPKPFVQGPQTAIVVGPAGDEIYTEPNGTGRVKVQFHWDRFGQRNENSSCWVRVSQPWAGKNWGAISIPRIGQEVIVDFLEGDPDRPIITGRVYNADQAPPYALPDNQTRSTFMSRSTTGGGNANYNEIRFEDKKGSEQLFMNAEMDMDLRVENASREYIGADRSLIVSANQRELVKADKHGHINGSGFYKVDGDVSRNVGGKVMEQSGGDFSSNTGGDYKGQVTGTHSLQVGKDWNGQIGGGLSLQVGQSRNEKIGQTHAMEAGQVIHLKAGQTVVIETGAELTLKGPGGFIDIGPAGVTIQGTMVLINSGGSGASGPGASPQSPASPDAPKDPKDPDTADDGTKGGKLN
jgi:type VI secretion system secreted protein VgrG